MFALVLHTHTAITMNNKQLKRAQKRIELIELMFYLSRRWHQNGNQCSDDEEGKRR